MRSPLHLHAFFPMTLIARVAFRASRASSLLRLRILFTPGCNPRVTFRIGVVRVFLGVEASRSSGFPAARFLSLFPTTLAAECSFVGGDLLRLSLLDLTGLSVSFLEGS